MACGDFSQLGGTQGTNFFQFSYIDTGIVSRFADDFTLAQSATFGTIEWWGVAHAGGPFRPEHTGFGIEFFEAAGNGAPGTLLRQHSIPRASIAFQADQFPDGSELYKYSVTLPTTLDLSAGTNYLLSIYAESSAANNAWGWQLADIAGGSWQQHGSLGTNWQSVPGSNKAYVLTPIPAPGAFLLGLIGFAGVRAVRRRLP